MAGKGVEMWRSESRVGRCSWGMEVAENEAMACDIRWEAGGVGWWFQLLDLGRNFSHRTIETFLHPSVCRGRMGSFDVSDRASDKDGRPGRLPMG